MEEREKEGRREEGQERGRKAGRRMGGGGGETPLGPAALDPNQRGLLERLAVETPREHRSHPRVVGAKRGKRWSSL